jgi:hypothetical protein
MYVVEGGGGRPRMQTRGAATPEGLEAEFVRPAAVGRQSVRGVLDGIAGVAAIMLPSGSPVGVADGLCVQLGQAVL